jgi:hypothetical protein
MFPFKTGDYISLHSPVSLSPYGIVEIDETLDDGYYAVRFLGSDDVFTVHGSELG